MKKKLKILAVIPAREGSKEDLILAKYYLKIKKDVL